MDCNFSKPWEIRVGDVLDKLREMPDESVHCVVTSPPYWNLRDYSVDGQIGLETTPEIYVAKMVEVFREVRRVLRSDGTCWTNLGDSFAGSWGNQGCKEERGTQRPINGPMMQNLTPYPVKQSNTGRIPEGSGLKPKDLIGVPWRVALALQADGWWLRSDIIWSKPNPMPESVTDRPTKAHEYLFLLTRSEKYFYDAEAVKERAVQTEFRPSFRGGSYVAGNAFNNSGGGKSTDTGNVHIQNATRNRRTVWTVASQPFKGAHFATFPPKLIEPCILAGTSEYGCCISCGAPWSRQISRILSFNSGSGRSGNVPVGKYAGTEQALSGSYDIRMGPSYESRTTGWNPSCDCVPNTPIPATVLDPFSGAATTLLVATQHGRNSIGIELNPEYAAMAERRLLAPPKTKKTERKKPKVLASNPLPLETLNVTSLFVQ